MFCTGFWSKSSSWSRKAASLMENLEITTFVCMTLWTFLVACAYGNHHGVLGISILLVKPICCALFLQYFLDFCINSSFCATKLLHDLESVGSATGHPTVVSVKQRGSCFAFSPSKYRKEPLKAQYLKHLMERTDMNDFSKLKYLFFISHYNFLGFSQFSPWRSIYCHFHRKEWEAQSVVISIPRFSIIQQRY